mgnify:CR=1 FL=1
MSHRLTLGATGLGAVLNVFEVRQLVSSSMPFERHLASRVANAPLPPLLEHRAVGHVGLAALLGIAAMPAVPAMESSPVGSGIRGRRRRARGLRRMHTQNLRGHALLLSGDECALWTLRRGRLFLLLGFSLFLACFCLLLDRGEFCLLFPIQRQ